MEIKSNVATFSFDCCFQGAILSDQKTFKKLVLLFIANSYVNLMVLWKVLSIIKDAEATYVEIATAI